MPGIITLKCAMYMQPANPHKIYKEAIIIIFLMYRSWTKKDYKASEL